MKNLLLTKFYRGNFDTNFKDGHYKVMIGGKHVLTKEIVNGIGKNLCGSFIVPFMNFVVLPNILTKTIDLCYEYFTDHIRKVDDGYYVGYLERKGKIYFWFEMIKEEYENE